MSPLVMILFLLYSTSTRTTIAHQYELQYCTTVQYNRAGGVPVFTRRVLKRGVRGGFPPWLGRGGGFKNRRFPPPHPSDDNVLYSIFAPCLVFNALSVHPP